MDSSPDLSVKLRRGSSDSRDNFYMGFAQGIDSDIEEVTTIQNIPSPPTSPTTLPALEEPPVDFILPIPVDESAPEQDERLEQLPDNDADNDEVLVYDEQTLEEIVVIIDEEEEGVIILEATTAELIEEFPTPPSQFQIPTTCDEDEDETNTSVTVIQTKHKTPSSSSSSISSTENELIADEMHKSPPQIADLSLPSPPISTPPPTQFFLETEFSAPHSPQSTKSPPSKKSHSSSRKSPSSSSLASHKSPKSVSIQKSPPKKLDFRRNESHHDSDSIDSINAIDCKIDDDNRDDSSPTDSMPPTQTPPPLEPLLLLERRYEYFSRCEHFQLIFCEHPLKPAIEFYLSTFEVFAHRIKNF